MKQPALFHFRLDHLSGVPVYRQIIDQIQAGIATGALHAGHQLPTVRQVAVDLAINPNTVMRAYRELEIRGVLDTQQGTGTFLAPPHPEINAETKDADRALRLHRFIDECVARAGAGGFTLEEILQALKERGT